MRAPRSCPESASAQRDLAFSAQARRGGTGLHEETMIEFGSWQIRRHHNPTPMERGCRRGNLALVAAFLAPKIVSGQGTMWSVTSGSQYCQVTSGGSCVTEGAATTATTSGARSGRSSRCMRRRAASTPRRTLTTASPSAAPSTAARPAPTTSYMAGAEHNDLVLGRLQTPAGRFAAPSSQSSRQTALPAATIR